MISSIGSFVMAVGMLVFVVNVVQTFRERRRAPATTRGSPTRSSGTRPRRRRPGTSTRVPYVTSARPLRDLRRRLAETRGVLMGFWARLTALAAVAGTGLAVVSGAAGWGTAHRVLAARRAAAARRAGRDRVGDARAASCRSR